jgi:hypothetical protein
MIQQSGWTGYNCTEGGILFGQGIEWIALDQFLKEQSKRCSAETSQLRSNLNAAQPRLRSY